MRTSIALVGALAALPILLPIIMQPHSASNMILHGPVIVDITFPAIVLLGMYYVNKKYGSRTFVDEKDKKLAKIDVMKKVVSFSCAAMFVGFSVFILHSAVRDTEIRNHGQRIMASVLDIYSGSCSKHGCREYVEYQFIPKSGAANSQPVTDYGDIANSNDMNNPHLVFARTQHHVPVAYDVRNPQVSTLNFNDHVFQRDPIKFAIGMIVFMGVVILVITGMTLVIFNSSRRKILAG